MSLCDSVRYHGLASFLGLQIDLMDTILEFINSHYQHAHWWFFSLLMLAGLNLPISEDLILVASGVMAAAVEQVNPVTLFIFVFLGCYLSDWVAYWIGRTLEPKLRTKKWFNKLFKHKRLDHVQSFYRKYGLYTLFVGRFIPFGVRNCLFMAAGIGRMHFGKFILSDGIACFASNMTLFCLSYSLEQHHATLLQYLKTFNMAIFSLFVLGLGTFIWLKLMKKRKKQDS